VCPTGYYSDNGATVCNLCEAGYKCPSPYLSMRTACTAGYYSAAGSVNCYQVPSHMTTSAVNIRPSWCSYSTYSALTANSCVTCPTNSWCPSDNVSPITCPMSVEDTLTSAYTSFAGELSCFPRTPTRGGTGAMYPNSVFDNHIPKGYYS